MKRGKTAVILALLLIPLFIAGCSDGKRLAEIEKTQEEILAKITALEKIRRKSYPKKDQLLT
ncbi:MAG: hypothetical protein L0922_06920 [Candidatus Mariimomonas ferrooxydans]